MREWMAPRARSYFLEVLFLFLCSPRIYATLLATHIDTLMKTFSIAIKTSFVNVLHFLERLAIRLHRKSTIINVIVVMSPGRFRLLLNLFQI